MQKCSDSRGACKTRRLLVVERQKKKVEAQNRKNRVSNILVYFDLNDYAVFIAVIISV